jgi:hypothetical protein
MYHWAIEHFDKIIRNNSLKLPDVIVIELLEYMYAKKERKAVKQTARL